MAVTYVDAAGAVAAWINSRIDTLVGLDNPLGQGAHFQHINSPAPVTYAFLEEITASPSSEENPDMVATLSAQVFGGTKKAACDAAVALAEELTTELAGRPATVLGALLWVADDVQGPTWAPDRGAARYLVTFTVRVRPN